MKILFVAHRFPFPPTTGNAHFAYHQIRGLAQRHAVDLVAFSDRPIAEFGGLDRCCSSIEIVKRSRPVSALKVLPDLASPRPWYVSYFRNAKMSMAVERRLQQGAHDAALFELSIMGQYLPQAYAGARIWSLEDPAALKELRQIPWYPWARKMLARRKASRYRQYERELASHFDRLLLLNATDASDYAAYLGVNNLDWVPYGIDTDYFTPAPEVSRREGMIVMTGNMYHPPNVVGVEWFCDRVFPLVKRKFPAANLWLVGARPGKAVQRRARDQQIVVTGAVPDIRPYQRQAKVSICPVQLRIGTQTKVLEAMSAGTPVVTTSAGNHGVLAVSGEHLHVADDPEVFAGQVVSLLRNERWSELSENGRKFVVENFTWERSLMRLERIVGELARRGASQ